MAQAPIFVRPPAFNVDSWTNAGDGQWTCPVIAVSDRAGLIEILRLCGSERFDEAYAFLASEGSFFEYESLDAVLSPHTQQFPRGDKGALGPSMGSRLLVGRCARRYKHIAGAREFFGALEG